MRFNKFTASIYLALVLVLAPMLTLAQVSPPGGSGGGGGGGITTDIQDGAGDSIMNAATNSMQITCVSGCGGSGGVSMLDDAAFSIGVSDVNPVGFLYDDTASDSVNEGDVGIARMSANRIAYSILRDHTAERGAGVNASNALLVTQTGELPAGTQNIGDVDIASIVSGTGATNLGKAEDAAHTSGDVGVMSLCVRHDTATTGLGADGDYTPCGISAAGRVYVDALVSDGSGPLNVIVDSGTITTVSAVTAITNALPAGTNVIGHVIMDTTSTTAVTQATGTNLHAVIDTGSTTAVTQATGTNLHAVVDSGTITTVSSVSAIIAGTGATNLGKAEDAAHSSGDTGVMALCVRKDTSTTGLGADGDYVPCAVNSSGALYVTGGGGGTEFNIGDAASATATGKLSLAIRDDALTTLADADGDFVALRVDAFGSLHVTIDSISSTAVTASVTEDGDIPADATSVSEVVAVLYCDNGTNPVHCAYTTSGGLLVSTAAVVPGTGATNLGKAEDAAHTTGDVGVMALCVRKDTSTTGIGANGDYVPCATDANGAIYVTGAGGGTQYVIGTVASATATGTMALGIRNDTPGTLADADGDVVGFRVNSQGALYVTGGGGGTEYVVNAAAPTDPTGSTFVMERDDVITTLSEVEGDWTNPRATAEGALWTQDFNSDAILAALSSLAGTVTSTQLRVDLIGALPAGTNGIGKLTANSGVDIGDVDVTSILPGSAATNLGKLEDAAHTTGDLGVMALCVRHDTSTTGLGADGDYAPCAVDANGAQYVTAAITSIAAGNNNIGDVDVASIAAGDNNIGNVDIVTMPGTAVEDAGETAGQTLVMVGSVRRDEPASSAGTTADNAGFNTNALGALYTATTDPCGSKSKLFVPINQTTGTQIITGTASNRTYVCSMHVVSATTQNIALVSGTGTVCATSLGPMAGGTTAATGWNFVANSGLALGNGSASIMKSDTDADNICILMSSTGQLSGAISYVVAPN